MLGGSRWVWIRIISLSVLIIVQDKEAEMICTFLIIAIYGLNYSETEAMTSNNEKKNSKTIKKNTLHSRNK